MNESARRVALSYGARVRGFDHLAFYKEDGDFQMIFGSQLEVDEPEQFAEAISGNQEILTTGRDASGADMLMIGIPAAYPLEEEEKSAALVGALPQLYPKHAFPGRGQSAHLLFHYPQRRKLCGARRGCGRRKLL